MICLSLASDVGHTAGFVCAFELSVRRLALFWPLTCILFKSIHAGVGTLTAYSCSVHTRVQTQ